MSTVGREYGRKLKIMENENHPLEDLKNDEITEKREKLEITLYDLEYGQKTENQGNWEIHTLRREIWRGKLKKVENLECPLQDVEYVKKTENHKMRNIHLTT